MLIIKIAIMLVCAVLWRLGGTYKKAWCRDILIPIILGVYLGFWTHWFIGFLTIGSFNIIKLGRGIPDDTDEGSWLGRTFRIPWLVRGMYGGITSLVGGINVYIYTQYFYLCLGYVALNFLVDATTEKMRLNPTIVELAEGLVCSSIVFFI